MGYSLDSHRTFENPVAYDPAETLPNIPPMLYGTPSPVKIATENSHNSSNEFQASPSVTYRTLSLRVTRRASRFSFRISDIVFLTLSFLSFSHLVVDRVFISLTFPPFVFIT